MRRVLIIGGGSIGERHARCFLATRRCAVAVCEPRAARRKELGERYALAADFPDLEAAVTEPWDAAVIATPAPFHIPQARGLVEQGIAVLIEKPLSTGLEGVKALQEMAARRAVPVRVAYIYRSHPAVLEARRRLASGELGDLGLVTVIGGQHFPTFRPDFREIYYSRRETGGGVIQDALTHLVDLTAHLGGPFEWVFADWARQVLTGVEVEDTANLTARLRGEKVLATLSCNQFQVPNETRVEFHGSDGSLRLEFPAHRWSIQRRGDDSWTVSEPCVRERDELFVRQAGAFLDTMEGKPASLCSLEEAEHALRVNRAALRSGETGLPVRIDDVEA